MNPKTEKTNVEGQTFNEVLLKYYEDEGEDDPKKELRELRKKFQKVYPITKGDINKSEKPPKPSRGFQKKIGKISIEDHNDASSKQNSDLNFIRMLYYYFDIPFEIFGVAENLIIPDNGRIGLGSRKFLSISNHNEKVNEGEISDFERDYTKLINSCLQKLKGELNIYEYLGRGDLQYPGKEIPNYLRVNGLMYEKTEKTLKDRVNISYSRIIALPRSLRFKYKDEPQFHSGVFENDLMLALKEMSPELLGHICRCIRDLNKTEKNPRVRFYISSVAPSDYQYALVDENLIFIEHYRTRRNKEWSTPIF